MLQQILIKTSTTKTIALLLFMFSFALVGVENAVAAEEGVFGVAGWGGSNNKIWWEYADSGTLTIRPLNSATSEGGAFLSKNYDVAGRADKTQEQNTVYQWPWQKYQNDIIKVNIYGKIYTDSGMKLNRMFANYPKLTEFNSSGLELVTRDGQNGQSFFSRVTEADEMFMNDPLLEKADLSGFRNNSVLWTMKRMFAGDPSLKTVILNNPSFKTRSSASNGVMMQGFFYGSDNLEYVDFSNITIGGRQTTTNYSNAVKNYLLPGDAYPNLIKIYYESGMEGTSWNDYAGFDNLFLNKTNLHTVKLINTKVSGMKGFASMFENCTSLDNWNGETGLDMTGFYPSDATDMRNMFKNTGFTTLNLSNIGTLENIVNMNGFIADIPNLQTLILDNLNNSAIGPTGKNHSISTSSSSNYPATLYPRSFGTDDIVSKENSQTTGAIEYGREIFGEGIYNVHEAYPNLTTISAMDSNIWLTQNTRGLAGTEYYNVSTESDITYLFNTKTTFRAENGTEVEIDSKRDYADLFSDRDGIHNHTTIPVISPLPDANTNLNIVNDLNQNGPNRIAAGIYNITSDPWEEDALTLPETYYRIAYIGEVPFRIEGIEPITPETYGSTDPELVLVKSENYAWLNTRSDIVWPSSGDYTIDRSANPIKITYEDAAIDINGKKHNVIITINKITFKNLERIPTYNSARIHDDNKYIDRHPTNATNQNNPNSWPIGNGGYYRTIMQASRDDGITFRNYVRVGMGNYVPGISTDWQVLSGGSGTDIDFSVEIEGANPDTSFVFHAEDLDVAESQNWNRPNNDADYDNLPIAQSIYGIGGESFVLNDGNDLNTVAFAEHTGLYLANNNVVSTGSDPSTTWSEFAVKSNATGANYTWKTGIASSTYALKNTEKINLESSISFEPVATVLVGGTLEADQFEFTLTPDSNVPNNMATGPAVTAKNAADGSVTFGNFTFDEPVTTIDGMDYYPGTVNDGTNTHGQGTHNAYVYAWTVAETVGSDPDIEYDSTPKKLKIIIATPESDTEMAKGLRADIYVDDILVKTIWASDTVAGEYIPTVIFRNSIKGEDGPDDGSKGDTEEESDAAPAIPNTGHRTPWNPDATASILVTSAVILSVCAAACYYITRK